MVSAKLLVFLALSHPRKKIGVPRELRSVLMPSIRLLLVSFVLLTAAALPAATFTVTTNADSGAGSLRQALADASAAAGADTIAFDPALSGQTITLTSGELDTADTGGVIVDATALPGGLTITTTGGSRAVYNTGTLTLAGLRFSGITTALNGGALFNQGKATLTNCTFSGNTGVNGGALYHTNSGNGTSGLTVEGCTFSGNTANGGAGGAVNIGRSPFGVGVTLRNCTIANNTAQSAGGLSASGGGDPAFVTLTHCTVAGNTGLQSAGGIYNDFSSNLTLAYCIVTGNTGGSGADIQNNGTLTPVGANLVTAAIGGTGTFSLNSTGSISTAGPFLGALGNNGGPTQTMLPQPGSPAIDAAVGSPTTVDQRGLARPEDGDNRGTAVADIGAVEVLSHADSVLAGLVPSTGHLTPAFNGDTTSYTLIVPAATSSLTLTPSAARAAAVLTVNGAPVASGALALNPAGTPTTLTITFSPAAGFSATTYTVTVQRRDALVVTTGSDSGAGSLRQALADAASASGPDLITFAPALNGATISLSTGALTVADVTLDATALANGLTLNGGGTDRIISVTGGSVVSLRGLTFTGGSSAGGGAIYNNSSANLSLEFCTLSGNTATSTGGGAVFNDAATLALAHCTLNGNVTNTTGGGAIFSRTGTLTLDGCTLSGNTCIGGNSFNGGGGAIRTSANTNTLLRCTLSGNTAPGAHGGALLFTGTPGVNTVTCLECTFSNNSSTLFGGAIRGFSLSLTLANCTFTGNTLNDPASEGGAIYSTTNAGFFVTHCTVVNNHAEKDGGGIVLTAGTITDSIVAKNTAAAFADVVGPATTTGRNIITVPPSVIPFGAAAIYQVDPQLAPLGNYGGPTQTMPPLATSPAIDQTVDSLFTNDQRGQPRPVSFRQTGLPIADIGAVEVSPALSDLPPASLTYSANPATYTRTLLIPNNSPTSSGGGGLTYSVAPALPAGLTLNPTTGVISGTPTVSAAAANYVVTATNTGGATAATLNITVSDPPPSYTQAQYDANGTANFTAGQTAGQNNVINNPNTFSLYTLSQVQTLNIGTPLLTKNAGTGQFKLTIGVKKTANLAQPFADFPMSGPQTSINGQGKLEFLFTSPDNAAFFRVQSN